MHESYPFKKFIHSIKRVSKMYFWAYFYLANTLGALMLALLTLSLIVLTGSFLLTEILPLIGQAFAAPSLPGSDESDKLQAAGTLLKLVDTALFLWGSRIFAGLAILSAGWSLKEQRFAVAAICCLAAIVIGTAPMWVQNIFEIGGGTLFSMSEALVQGEMLHG